MGFRLATHYEARPLGWKPVNVTLLSMFSRSRSRGLFMDAVPHCLGWTASAATTASCVSLKTNINVPLLNHTTEAIFYLYEEKQYTDIFFIKIVKIVCTIMLRFYDENKNPLCSLTNTNKTIMFHVFTLLLCFYAKTTSKKKES